MDKKPSNYVPQYSQLYNDELSFSKQIEINNNTYKEVLNENCTQEDIECSESTANMENIPVTKFDESNYKNLNNIQNIDEKNSTNCVSHYIMRKIEDPVNNEIINKSSNELSNRGYWGFGVVSNYVIDGLQKMYPILSPTLKAANSNDNKEINITNTKKSLDIDKGWNKNCKEEENITNHNKLLNDKSKTESSDLNRATYGYLPNWDTLVGATSNLMETTTTVVSLTTNVLKTATEAGIKNIKSINQKNNHIDKAPTQLSVHSNNISCQESLKSLADYDYIDLVTANKQLDENANSKDKI